MGACLSKYKVLQNNYFAPLEDCELPNTHKSSKITEETKAKFCPWSSMEILPFENEFSFFDSEDVKQEKFKPVFLSRKYNPSDIITIWVFTKIILHQ